LHVTGASTSLLSVARVSFQSLVSSPRWLLSLFVRKVAFLSMDDGGSTGLSAIFETMFGSVRMEIQVM
jgi:hypothetical protein